MADEPPEKPPQRLSAWDRLRRSKSFWVVVGAVITFGLVNAGRVIGVQKDWRELRNSGRVEFNHAADAEREFYAGLYRDHLAIADKADVPRRRSQEVIGITLTSRRRPAEALTEFSYGGGFADCTQACSVSLMCKGARLAKREDWARCGENARCPGRIACEVRSARLRELASYRAGLERLVALGGVSAPVQEAAYSTDQSTAVRTRDEEGAVLAARQPEAAEPAPAGTSVEALPLASIVLADANPKGWDVDVFWCGRDDAGPEAELVRYRRASAAAQRLAEAARKQLSLRAAQETVVLGRVRLRPLPAATNARLPGYQFARDELRYEQATESLAAEAVQRWTGLPLFRQAVRNAPPTPWYVSMFVCGGALPSAAPPGAAGVAGT